MVALEVAQCGVVAQDMEDDIGELLLSTIKLLLGLWSC
jgi:hypothetical protein